LRPNRRHFSRAAVTLPAQYAIAGQPPWHSSTIVNIGGGGVRLETVEQLVNVTDLSIRFTLDGTTLVAPSRIVQSSFDRSAQCYVSGAAFTSIDPRAQQKIVSHVAELLARGAGT
jgi:c-di-GMP-binding flagellar brake protein YcgR